ncbi:Alpha-glucosides permease MPH2 [Colletotrichum orbiculare MAFF 240422]|uniref:Alpha-glucosides permease MPH2 n=3 Tax=Colletotrichum orbiculare species complex TaxID=2707354 RepID=N4VQM0_COLOR|nr:Alpha-glucosides permease MPH2 [Colletotrichum orbiculare MAFF 240422]TDZ35526.1 Alpha-glucosides permease MPH2 [Colletotrichum spinosum]TDZ61168.1 Alpha-glucosides permease MPH2 [Colletotrichum trifolii]
MSHPVDSKSPGGNEPATVEAYSDINHEAALDEKSKPSNLKADAIEAEQIEFNMGVLEAVKLYPMASLWAFIMSTTIIMESYCVFLMGAFVSMDKFKEEFGVLDRYGVYQIEASWQSALQVGGPLGAIVGVCIAGPITSRIGYRWATIGGLMLLNAFIFVFFFANSLALMFVSQLLEGVPWGIFIANAPAYCSEIVPMRLRAPATQMLQMFWAIGAIIVGGVCYVYESKQDSSAWKVPIALQWMFPTPLAVLLFIAPESPWWLVRKGRLEEAAVAVRRLGRSSATNSDESVAMIRRTIDLEKSEKEPSYLELFRGVDTYRTLIVCGVYAAQNLTGNLIANQAVYFFRQAGIDSNLAFALGLITSALQTVFVMLSWVLTTYLGRRTIYVWGSLINVMFLIALGIAGSVGDSTSASLAMASLGLIVSVGFTLGPAPASWVIIAETSAIRLRPLTTGIGRAAYYIVNIPCIFLSTYMLNSTGVDLGGRCGYVWGATGFVCFLVAFFYLPEMKGRSVREIDIMFKRKVPARKWKGTIIDINDDE